MYNGDRLLTARRFIFPRSANVLVFASELWHTSNTWKFYVWVAAMSVSGQLIEVAPPPRAGPDVIDAVRVGGTFRVLDERVERRPMAGAPGLGAGVPRWLKGLARGFFGLGVAFVAKIVRMILSVAVLGSLVLCAICVGGGLLTGVANAYNWAGVFFGIGFCAFVVLWTLGRLELWGESLALRR